MKNILIYSIVITAIISSCGLKNDKFRNNLNNHGKYIINELLISPETKWKYKTKGQIHASVVTDGNNIFVGSGDSCFYSLEAKSGELNWKYKTNGKIFSTAIIQGKYVYFLSYDGFLYKLKKNSGEFIWKFSTLGEKTHKIKNYYNYDEFVPDFWDFYQSSPSILDDKIYFGCGQYFYSVNIHSGKELWKYKTDGVIHSSPAIQDHKVVFGSYDSRVYCLDANTGNEIWTYETGRDTAYYVWLGVEASPMIHQDKVYIGSRDAKIYCFDLNSGDTIWTNNNFNRSWMPSSFANGKDKIYCGSSDGFSFYEINKKNGKIEFSVNTNSYTFSSPALTDQLAYIGSANGRLYAINLDDKKVQFEYKTTGVLSDSLKIYTDDGILDRERMKEIMKKENISDYKSLDQFYNLMFESFGAIVSSPVMQNGVIYFTSCDGYIYAIADK